MTTSTPDAATADAPPPRARPNRGGRLRRIAVVALIVLSCLSLTASVVGVWSRRNFLETDRFMDRVGGLIENPAVQEALTIRVTDQLMVLIDPRALFEEVLPERGEILAAPLANAVEGFVRDRVEIFIASDGFARLWEGAIRLAHETAVRVLRDEGDVLLTEDGNVTLNLVPVVNEVLRRITEASPEILGREVDLPNITLDDVPEAAIVRLEDALGVDLDDDFGRFTVYDRGSLEAVQDIVALFDRIVVVLLPLGVGLAALAVFLSKRRRRTLLQLGVGLALGMVVIRRISFLLQDEVSAIPPTPRGQEAAGVAIEQFLDPLTTFAGWVLMAVAVLAAVAVLTADYPWVVSLRRRVGGVGASVVGAAGERARDESTVAWIREHRDLLLAAGALVGFLVLWTTSLSWAGLLVVLALTGAFELAVYRVGAPTTAA